MLNDTVKYLAKRLKESGLFASVSGIVDIVAEHSANGGEPMQYPAFYTGADSLRFVANFDFRTGVAFFLSGRTTTNQEAGKRACATFLRENQRPVLYVIAKRPGPDSIADLQSRLTKLLTIRNTPEARTETNSTIIRGIPTGFDTDAETVLRDVFRNVDIPHRHDLVFMRVDLSYDSYQYTDCLTTSCP